MNPIRAEQHLFYLADGANLKASGALERRIASSDQILRRRAGDFFFDEYAVNWDERTQDEAQVTPRDEWATARILRLLQDADPDVKPEAVFEVTKPSIRVRFEVRDLANVSQADVTFVACKDAINLEGIGPSCVIWKSIFDAFQKSLFAAPESLAVCRIHGVPDREEFGWTGTGFAGSSVILRPSWKKKKRPTSPVVPLPPAFRIYERPRVEKPRRSHRLRYTDDYPPPSAFDEFPNWCPALEEEGRRGQDETTVKPCVNQRALCEECCLTAGDCTLANGTTLPALIHLHDGTATSVTCFDLETHWSFSCHWQGPVAVDLTAEQRSRFPLRVVSRLSWSLKKPSDVLCLVISEDGRTALG
jgi:hypothetical protein